MKEHAHLQIATTAVELAGKAHAAQDLYEALFTLVQACCEPPRRPMLEAVEAVRRLPAAGEVLPPRQRATWARAKTVYDP